MTDEPSHLTRQLQKLADVLRALRPEDLSSEERANMHALLIELTYLLGVESRPAPEEEEPDIDDEPPPDYGPPDGGAVITEFD